MKRTLLIAILALSINAFAQTRMPAPVHPKPSLNSLSHVRDKANLPAGINDKIASVRQTVLKDLRLNKDALIQLYDSIFVWEWEQSLSGWMIAGKLIGIEYDANNNMTGYVAKSWNGNTWENYIREDLTYDVNNNMLTLIDLEWDGTEWINSYQGIYTYDANNNMLSKLFQSWNGSVWVNESHYTYTYDANNNLLSDTGQSWSWIENDWLNNYRTVYTYDVNNNLTNETYLSWLENSWINLYQAIYTYDLVNILYSKLFMQWDGTEWINNAQYNYTYDEANNLILKLIQLWDGSVWYTNIQVTLSYDTENKLIHELGQFFEGNALVDYWQKNYNYNDQDSLLKYYHQYWTGSEWIPNSMDLFAYDETSNFKYSQSTKQWEYTGNEVLGGDSIYYYFHTGSAGINDVSGSASDMIVYPVPASDILHVPHNPGKVNSIDILNLDGKKESISVNNENDTGLEINLQNLKPGMYLIRIVFNEGTITRKFIKE